MSIYSTEFKVYEKLAASKMNDLVTAINVHNHDGVTGVKVLFENLDGYLQASQVPAGLITGAMIAANSITSSHIVNQTIVVGDMDTDTGHSNSVKVSGTGYALYAP